MSASNWAECHGCTVKAQRKAEESLAAAQASYGKVSAEEYERLRSQAQELFQVKPEQTFREDWEIYGAETGTVTVSYSGGCSKCGASASFEFAKEIST
jgi:Na+-transporting NADH:ubiquinone oxidoreductase subunit NqrF